MLCFDKLDEFSRLKFPYLEFFFNESGQHEFWLDNINQNADKISSLRKDLSEILDSNFGKIIQDEAKRMQIYQDMIFALYLTPYKQCIASVYYIDHCIVKRDDVSFVRDIYLMSSLFANKQLVINASDYYTEPQFLSACKVLTTRLEQLLKFSTILKLYHS